MRKAPKLMHKVLKLFLLFLLVFILLSSGLLYASYNIGNTLIHTRNLKEIKVSLDQTQFPYEEIEFKSIKDSITLKGVFFTPKETSDKTLILVHGYNENRMMDGRTKALVEYLVPLGYNILTFDLRGQGESEGGSISFGCYEKYDVLGAVDYLKQRGEEGERIALLGFSMGAVTVIEAAAVDSRIDAVIADSPFRDLQLYLMNDLDTLPDKPSEPSDIPGGALLLSIAKHIPINAPLIKLASRIFNINIDEVSPVNSVKNAPGKPILLIHGKEDNVIPYTNSVEIFNTLKDNADASLWLTENTEHIGSLKKYTQEYLARVKNFLEKYM